MKYFSVSVFLLLASSIYAQHNYYVGNPANRREHISLSMLSHLSLNPGDTIFFPAGDTTTGTILLSNIHGSPTKNIVLTSYGQGKAVIDGKNGSAVAITVSDYFKIFNLTLKGAGRKAGNTKDGLKLVNCNNAMLKNVDISGFQKSGLETYNCSFIEIDHAVAHENGFAGILVDGDYQKRISDHIRIINCRADNNPGDPTKLDNHSGNGILVGNCKNVLIEYCTASNNGWDMPRVGNGPVGIWAYEADSVTIENCISYHNKTAKGAADGGGFDLDGGVTNSVIQYCLSYENWGSGYGIFEYGGADKWYNNTLRYCISINDGLVTDHASAMLIWNGDDQDSSFTN